MIYIALGSNLPTRHGGPRETITEAVKVMDRRGVGCVRMSSFYRTRPVPDNGQPWFLNAVMQADTKLTPQHLMNMLHLIEAEFGRLRFMQDGPRTLDLDLLAYDNRLMKGEGGGVLLPHPRMHKRAFVLEPLNEIAPDWIHPVLHKTPDELLQRLPGEEQRDVMKVAKAA